MDLMTVLMGRMNKTARISEHPHQPFSHHLGTRAALEARDIPPTLSVPDLMATLDPLEDREARDTITPTLPVPGLMATLDPLEDREATRATRDTIVHILQVPDRMARMDRGALTLDQLGELEATRDTTQLQMNVITISSDVTMDSAFTCITNVMAEMTVLMLVMRATVLQAIWLSCTTTFCWLLTSFTQRSIK